MSDQDQIDVTTTDDTPEPSKSLITTKCAYCDCEKEGLPVFHCDGCEKWVHTSCLRSGSPSPILFDNYFVFKCIKCSEDGNESFARMKLTWNQVTCLALFNIAQQSPGKQGFHKWKETIGEFCEKYWDLLFESHKKKTPTYINTIAATLSAGNPHQFTSGYGFFKESGWWKLTDPTIAPEYTPPTGENRHRDWRIRKAKAVASTPSPSSVKLEGLRKRPYLSSAFNASQIKEKRSRTQASSTKEEPQDETNKNSPVPEESPPSFKGCGGSPFSSPLSSPRSLSVTSMLSKGEIVQDSTLPLAMLSDDSDIEPDKDKSKRCETPDKHFRPLPVGSSAMSTPRTSPPLPSSALLSNDENSYLGIPMLANCNEDDDEKFRDFENISSIAEKKFVRVSALNDKDADSGDVPRLRDMSLYEEKDLLKKLESYGSLLKDVPEAYRLRRKLLVRQKKRELNIPIVSFDNTVRRLAAKESGLVLSPEPKGMSIATNYPVGMVSSLPNSISSTPHHRILDRFQISGLPIHNELQLLEKTSFRQKLVGSDENELLQPIVSPYTQRILKPYIRRDYESKPRKLAVMEEIIARGSKGGQDSATCIAPIDYQYVRPHHIPTINAICHHFFWPGIDLSETLQYPDFSIVALYKKMVIGFGFMVPDVNFNEAYISFLFVHPDWQHAGIGTFILYHLIQTCMGKEVTLHVSASNSAMLLYQKFGFKPEKFIADFYDKYHSVDSTECKHAFFMRLRR